MLSFLNYKCFRGFKSYIIVVDPIDSKPGVEADSIDSVEVPIPFEESLDLEPPTWAKEGDYVQINILKKNIQSFISNKGGILLPELSLFGL